jgi:gliding motility-associated-like protein
MVTTLRLLKGFLPLFLFSILLANQADAQCPTCTATTVTVNLSSQTDTAWTLDTTRNGNCCSDNNCIKFIVFLNPASDLLEFDVTNPSPSGSANYQINCGPLTPIGTPACIIGLTSPICITYCKPGGDSPIYHITATRTVQGSNDITVRQGCGGTMSVTGMAVSSITWTSISPGAPGTYNSYLSCTSACANTTVTPTSATPTNVCYKVSGNANTSCPGITTDTICVTVVPAMTVAITPANPVLCSAGPGSVTLTATPTGGASPYTYLWSPGNQTTQSISVSSPGTYTVSVGDATSGCPNIVQTITVLAITTPPAPTTSSNSPVCAGSTINLTASAIAGATYSWTGPGGFTSALQNPTRPLSTVAMAGTYSVVATVSGCSGPAGTTTVVVNPIPATPTAGSNSPVCTGNTLNLTSTTIAGATYSWTGPNGFTSSSQNPSITNITSAAAGTYSVTATVNGCASAAGTVTVTVNTTPAAPTAGSNSPICAGSTLNLTATPVAGATYSWTGPNGFTSSSQNPSLANATTAASGTYSVTATVGGCPSASGTVSVTVNPVPAAPTASSNSPVCAGSPLNLTSTAVAGATYSWTGPNGFTSALQNPSIASPTTAATGTYSVTVTVAGCTSAAGTTSVTVNPIPAAPTASSNSPICAGSTLNLTASAVAGATYSWTGPNGFTSSSQNPSIVNATTAATGTYSVTVTVSGCTSAAATTAVTVNAVPAAPTAGSNSPICAGSTLNLTASNIAGATYSWTGPNGFTSSSQNPSIANATTAATGTYSVTATVGGCTGPAGVVAVTVNPTPAPPTASSNSPVCTGGTINLTASNVAGATYSWTGPGGYTSILQNPSRTNATAAMAGVYSVTITVAGCTSSAATTTVVVNTTPAAPTTSSNSPICAGSTLNLTASNIAGATYSWTGPNGFTSSSQNPSIANATTAATGTYSVTATVGGCTSVAGTTAVIVNPIPAAPTAGSNSPICAGSTLSLTASSVAGASYSWTGPNSFTSASQNPNLANATTAASGTYSVTITVSGCTSSAGTVSVTVNPIPAAPAASSNSPVCAGSTLNLSASAVAGGTYAWIGPNSFTAATQNPSISNITSAGAGTYSVTVTVAGCTSVAGTTSVTVNPIPATPAPSSNSPICVGATLNLTTTAVAGATYSWTGPNGFTSSSQNPSIAGATTAATGTYSLTITVNGCTSAAGTVTATVNSAPATPTAGSNTPVCTGTTLNLTASTIAGATYSWTGPNGFTSTLQNPTISNITAAGAGTYTVTANNGCASSPATTIVVVNATPATPTAGSNSPICDGSTLNLTSNAVAGATYSWTGPNGFTSASQNPSIANATTAASGTYSVNVIVNGCTSANGTVAVTVNPIPASPVPGSNSPICAGSTLNLTATTVGGATYSWSGPNGFSSTLQNPSISNATTAASGTYTVTSTVAGCTSPPATVVVTVNAIPATPTASSNSPICAGSSLNLTANTVAGATYSWIGPNLFFSTTQNPSIANATTAASGTYSVTITVNGCASAAGTTSVTVNPIPATPAPSSNSPICVGATLNLTTTAVAGATYSWNGPNGFTSSLQNPNITNATLAASGTYTLTVTVNGCTSPAGTVTVAVNSPPSAPTAGSNSPVCTGTSLNLTASTIVGATYSWTGPGGFTSTLQNPTINNVTAAMAGTYSVTANNGCASSAGTVLVVVNATPAAPTASSNSPLCVGSTINLNSNVVAGATYSWTGPNGFTASTQNTTIPNATTADGGTYSVTVTVNGCTSNAGTVTVTVNPPPATPSPSSNSPVCTGTTLSLTTATVAGATYSWSGPNGFTSSLQNPNITNVTAAAAGTYSLTISVLGCPGTAGTTVVVVNTTPAAPTASSNSPICDGSTLNLTANTIAGATYSWTGPNGFTDTQQNPSIVGATPAESGTYSVTVTVNGCTGSAGTTIVVVNPIPATPAPSSNSPICVGSTLNLTTTAVAGATYSWTGPNGFTSSLQNPSIVNATAAATGTYSLTITVNGCTSAVGTTFVGVNSAPATPVASSNSPVCTGTTLQLTADTIPGATYSWSGPNGFTSTLQNPSITNVTMAAAGTYTVTANNGCASVPSTITVVVNATPATPNPNSNSPLCVGSNLTLTVGSTAGATYSWTGPNGYTSSTQNNTIPNVTTAESGTYSLTITVNGCTSSAGTENVVISAPAIVSAGSNQTVCANNDTVLLAATSTTGSGTWSTSGSGAFVPNNTTLNATYIPSSADTAAGSVTLTFTSTNNGACAPVTGQIVITITDAPTANAGADQTVCANNSAVSLNGAFSVAGGINWSTSGDGTFTNASAASTTYNPGIGDTTSGTVTLYMTTTGNGQCLAAIDSMIVTITPAPVANAGPDPSVCINNPNVTLSGTSTTGTGTWSTNGSGTFTPNANSLNATYNPSAGDLSAGSILIFLSTTNNGNCLSEMDTIVVTFSQPPVVAAGPDITVCANNAAVMLSGTSTTGSGLWTTSGSGTFTPAANLLNPTYNPSAADTAAGTVTLTFTSTNNGGCLSVNDQLVITITDAPTANAGPDQSICANNAIISLSGTFTIGTGGVWSTSGSGTFSPSTTAANVTYTASAADTAAGSVFIMYTTTGNGLCNATTDTMQLIIFDAPLVNAGPDELSCINNPNTPLNGTSTTGSGTWTTLGSGSFSPSANILNPTYVPSAADTTNGSVTLILTSTGNGSCLEVSDTMVITFAPEPTIAVGPDQTVCANNASILLSASSSTGTGIWTTSGDGTFAPNATTLNATYAPGVNDTAAGSVTLTFTASNSCTPVFANVVLTITPAPYVLAGPDVFTCANNPDATLSGYIGGATNTGSWSTSGGGTFSPSTSSMNVTYSPDAGDIIAGSVWLILTSSNNGTCFQEVDSVLLTITFPPVANAGTDATTCAGSPAQLTGTITAGNGTGVWSTPNGNGSFTPSNNNLNASYVPTNSDTLASPIMIILTSTNNGGCFPSADTMFLIVTPGPEVDAGPDTLWTCANNAPTVLSGSLYVATGGVWTTSGNGTFTPDSTDLNASYVPDTSDISAGAVTLYLTSTGNGLCSAVMDSLVLVIGPAPIVTAGGSQIVCDGTPSVVLGGNVTGGSTTGMWSTSGDGTFSPNDSTLNATYIFGTADTTTGSVTLYLVSTNNANCLAVTDSVTYTITPVPFAMAGNDTMVCQNTTGVQLNGQIIGTPGTGMWTSSGTGTFTPDSTALNAVYIPSAADTAAGTVTLILSSTNACLTQSDTVVVTFAPAPVAIAGNNALICAGDVVSLNGSVSNTTGMQWTTSGDGTFTPSDTVANATYIPGTNDTASGSVTITLTSTGNAFCSPAADSLIVTINSKPNALFTSGPACMNSPVTFADSSTNTNGSIVSWAWTSGTDTSSQQNPNFTYSTTGNQTVTLVVSTAAGCADTVSMTLFVNAAPVADFGSTITCPTDVALLDSSSISLGTIVSWNWNLGDSTSSTVQNPVYTYTDTGMYVVTLTVTSDSGCTSSFVDTLTFIPCPGSDVNPPAVPTAFTPNGDNINDILFVKGGPFSEINFKIYNEWGNLIFESSSQSTGWDGTYKGKDQPAGTYVWVIKATTIDGVSVEGTGEVTLLR